MRVGLVFAQTRVPDGTFLSEILIGEVRVLQRQIAQCIALGCTKILCVMDEDHPQYEDLSHAAPSADIPISPVSPAHLVTAITAQDDVVVMGEGVVADYAHLRNFAQHTHAIAAFSAEWAIDLGYERIDKDHAFAGLMVIAGRLVAKLADLPSDFDRVSSLLRLALQERAALTLWDRAVFLQSGWARIAQAADAQTWFVRARDIAFPMQGRAASLASLRSEVLRRAVGEGRSLSQRIAIAHALGLGAMILAALLGVVMAPALGCLGLAMAGIFLDAREELAKFKRDSNLHRNKTKLYELVYKYVIDVLLLCIMLMHIYMSYKNQYSLIAEYVITFLCYISMWQLILLKNNRSFQYEIRIATACGIAGVTALGILMPVLYIFAIGAACIVLYEISSQKITRD